MSNISDQSQAPEQPLKVCGTYKCSMCSVEFVDSTQQRVHMKGDWHIYNLHRKIDGQSPVSEKEYLEASAPSSPKGKGRSRQRGDEVFVRRQVVARKGRPILESSSEEEEVEEEDDESEEVSTEEEESDQNFGSSEEDNAELNDAIAWQNNKELKLASGKVISSRSAQHDHTRQKRTQPSTLPPPKPETSEQVNSEARSRSNSPALTLAYLASTSSSFPTVVPNRDRTMSRRDGMGIVGLTDIEKKALLATEKKMMKLETRAKSGFAESVDAKGNCQKHYRIGGSRGGKKMGGLEKRLG